MGTVVSKRTAPSFPSPSPEIASVENIAAARMLTAVHNNARCLTIASLPCFFVEPALPALEYHFPLWMKFQ
jgi:hypothetical protein